MSSNYRITLLVLVVAGAGGAFFWARHHWTPPTMAPPPRPPSSPPAAPIASPAPTPAAPPAVHYPVPPPTSSARLSPDGADAQVKRALAALLGQKAGLSLLSLDGFVRRFVATVDNLATDDASAQMWPVRPTAGRIDTVTGDGGVEISGKNADRYASFMRLVESVETERGVALYRRLYPLFQRAYEDLGYPGRYFNDRVIEVIDNLLAAPTLTGPIRVQRLGSDGGAPREGGLYVFADPRLETCSAGQKILMRMGREDEATLKAKLSDIRQRLVGAASP